MPHRSFVFSPNPATVWSSVAPTLSSTIQRCRASQRLRHDGTDTGLAAAFRQRLGEHSFTAQYGPLLAPKPCLPRPTVLADDTYLLAYDTRADGVLACGLFRRSQMTGLADWNARTSARP
jgi:hypothetical protein